MKIILCSKSNIKKDMISRWFKEKKNIEIDLEKIDIENDALPPQPIGDDIKLICLKKINDIRDNYNNIDYIISIENYVDILEDMLNYRLCMCVYKYNSNEYVTIVNDGVSLDLDIMNNYPNFLLVLKDLKDSYKNTKNKYIFNGCEDKLSNLVHKYYPDIPKNNFIKLLKNKKYDKFNQFSLLLDEIFI